MIKIDFWKDFHTRQRVLAIFVVVIFIAAVFYWTNGVFIGMKEKSIAASVSTDERINNVKVKLVEINDKKVNSKVLNTGLMSHIQGLGDRIGGSSRFLNLKLVNSQARQEQVSFRTENLVYQDFVIILKELEQYDNIWVKTISVSKRFDNPMRIDVMWDVVRGVQ